MAVWDEQPFEAGLDHPAEGVMDYPVAKGCDAALNRLRLYLRMAHHWRWLSDGQYRHVSERVAEVGRLLGGWIKQAPQG